MAMAGWKTGKSSPQKANNAKQIVQKNQYKTKTISMF